METCIVVYTKNKQTFDFHIPPLLKAFQTTLYLHVDVMSEPIEKYVLIKIPMYM